MERGDKTKRKKFQMQQTHCTEDLWVYNLALNC